MADVNPPTLQDFIALGRAGFARTDRFVVVFTAPPGLPGGDMRSFSMLCEEAAFPGKVVGTRTLRINALNEQRAHTIDFMGDTITFQFIVDLNWRVRQFFENWIDLCVGNQNTTSVSREVGYYSDYIQKISVYALAPSLDPENPDISTYQLDLYEAWPRNMNVQQISYNNTTYHRLNVTFTYKYWKSIYTGEDARVYIPSETTDPLQQPNFEDTSFI